MYVGETGKGTIRFNAYRYHGPQDRHGCRISAHIFNALQDGKVEVFIAETLGNDHERKAYEKRCIGLFNTERGGWNGSRIPAC